MKILLITIVLIVTAANCFSQERQISFTDGTNLNVSDVAFNTRVLEESKIKISRISVMRKEFAAFLTGTGKAVRPLDESALKLLKRKDKPLASQIERAGSAYNLTQNGTDYYFAGLNSIADNKYADCSTEKPCKIRCRAIIIRLVGGEKIENILILKSFVSVE